MKRLLYLKSWQLFLLIFIPIWIGDLFFGIVGLIGWSVYFLWVYTIGTTMNSLILTKSKPKIRYFNISCVIVVLTSFIIYLMTYLNIIDDDFILKNFRFGFPIVAALLIIELYTFVFAASMLESAIQGKIVNRSDSIKFAFFIWFFPIGIWYIQPVINKVLAEQSIGE